MKMSKRELFLLIATVYVVLFAGVAMMARPKIDHLKEIMAEQDELRYQIDRDEQSVARKRVLEEKYDELSKLLRPASRDDMGVHWQQVLDRIASKNNVQLINLKAGLENQVGDVYEILIDCRSWEGDLDALVHFLFDLHAEGAMLDIRRLLVKTSGGKLSGTFGLYCAYTRTKNESENENNAEK